MKRNPLIARASLLFIVAICALPHIAAQVQVSTGSSVEFVAQVKPQDGQLEPVRQLPFYLLRKSLAEIRAEAERAEPSTGMDEFIETLKVSTELKVWMKAHHRVDLAGADFTKQLTPEDVVNIPEFLSAYNAQNGGTLTTDFPEPKPPKAGSKPSDNDKYQHQLELRHQALLHYLRANLDSLDGLDADLGDQNPERLWVRLQNEQRNRIESRTLKLAQTQYLAARTNTNLDGRGVFAGVAPGEYWITTLDTSALAGDQRLRWNVSVTVRPGQIARVELSNLNAMDLSESATH
jgi:hypothetical protein